MIDFQHLGEDGFNARYGASATADRITPERWREPGPLAWDPEGALDEFSVYADDGHPYEYAAQIEAFQDRRRRSGAT